MAVYQVVTIGDPILREGTREVKNIGANIHKLLDNMKDTMYENEGVGLAAPQIGIPKRVIVVDIGEGVWEMINPRIISYAQNSETMVEGCLSVPGVEGEVSRPAEVQVKALNREGEQIQVEAEGLLARVLQHEIDHLEGILFVDKVDRFVEDEEKSNKG